MVDKASSLASYFTFRGDDYYKKGSPIGFDLDSEEAQAADIQSPWEHVQDKESNQTSRFISFSLSKQGGAVKFTKKNKIIKVAWIELKKLQAQGKIKIYEPEDVANLMRKHSKKKIQNQAKNVKAAMEKNGEILIEGQIPADLIVFAN